MAGGGGMPALGKAGGDMASMGVGILPGMLLSKIFGGQGGQQGQQPTFGGGMFGNPSMGSPFMPMPGQQAAPGAAAQSQIQSLLSGSAKNPFAGAGAPPSMTGSGAGSFGAYSGPMTPGIEAAMKAGGSGVPGGGNPQYGGIGALLGGPAGMVLGNMFEKNNSQIQDIAGALYQGLPITDADWKRAGFGPGGVPLGGA